MFVYCPECESACSEQATFCPQCGHPLTAKSEDDFVAAIHADFAAEPILFQDCPRCGQRMDAKSSCPICDVSVGKARQHAVRKYSGYATASFVCGLCSVTICAGIPLGILAIVFGEMAYRQFEQDRRLGGKGLAKAGYILGTIGLIGGFIALVAWFVLSNRSTAF